MPRLGADILLLAAIAAGVAGLARGSGGYGPSTWAPAGVIVDGRCGVAPTAWPTDVAARPRRRTRARRARRLEHRVDGMGRTGEPVVAAVRPDAARGGRARSRVAARGGRQAPTRLSGGPRRDRLQHGRDLDSRARRHRPGRMVLRSPLPGRNRLPQRPGEPVRDRARARGGLALEQVRTRPCARRRGCGADDLRSAADAVACRDRGRAARRARHRRVAAGRRGASACGRGPWAARLPSSSH